MPVINGTEGPDNLDSTAETDFINALGGDDTVTMSHPAISGQTEHFDGGEGNDLFVVRLGSGFHHTFDATLGTFTRAAGPSQPASGFTVTFANFERFDIQLGGMEGNSIRTLDGDDVVRGGSGGDAIRTAGGNDHIFADNGDHGYGGAGDDLYTLTNISFAHELADEGIDTIHFNDEPFGVFKLPDNIENLFATKASFFSTGHQLRGNTLDNIISGNEDNDIIDAQDGGADSLFGHDGNDQFRFAAAFGPGDTVDGGAGNDSVSLVGTYDVVLTGVSLTSVETLILGAGFNYRLVTTDALLAAGNVLTIDATALGAAHRLTFDGRAETDAAFNIVSGFGDDLLYGGAGNDMLAGGAGNDLFFGGAGNDTYIAHQEGDVIAEAVGEGNDIAFTSISYRLAAGIELETLSAITHSATSALNLIGNEFAQTLIGNYGANTLDGGEGADTLHGLLGDDIYIVDNAGDTVIEAEGEGNDIVYALASYALTSNQSIETLSTRNHGETQAIDLVGNQLNNTLIGNNGNNVLNGNAGADTMIGLAGDDTYVIDDAGDLVIDTEGQGNDTVFTYLSHTLTNGNQIETLSTVAHQGTTAINLGGSDYDNTLIGNYGANYINGNGGADTMIGLNGDDTYVADDVGDVVQEAAGGGNDVLFTFASHVLASGQEVEAISTAAQGGTAAINLTGNEFGQIIVGNAGVNVIDGKGGNDTLHGLDGADTFAFTTALGAGNVDTVADFLAGTDKIGLDDAIFTAIGGALGAGAFVTGTAAADADDRIIYNSATGALFYDADGNGAGAAVQFATLSGLPVLTAGDFMVI
jgi:Ca2+-binding RTX toxin-like protein